MVKNLISSLLLAQNWASQIIFFVSFTSIRCLTLFQAIIVCKFKEN